MSSSTRAWSKNWSAGRWPSSICTRYTNSSSMSTPASETSTPSVRKPGAISMNSCSAPTMASSTSSKN
jgi:3D (Asp-Asp-Asp) domain-containing protein